MYVKIHIHFWIFYVKTILSYDRVEGIRSNHLFMENLNIDKNFQIPKRQSIKKLVYTNNKKKKSHLANWNFKKKN